MNKINKLRIIITIISFILIAGGLIIDLIIANNINKDPNIIGHWVPAFVMLGLVISILLWIVVSIIELIIKHKKEK